MGRVGKFLIARPTVNLGFFSKTVVFVYEDSTKGTAGLALTTPSSLSFSDLARERNLPDSSTPHTVYRGGPVALSAVMMLHSTEFTSANTLHTKTGYDVSSDEIMIEKISAGVEPVYFRLTVGGSVWAPGQLDAEIARGCWLVSDLDPEIVFGLSGDEQWAAAIEYAGSQIIARYF